MSFLPKTSTGFIHNILQSFRPRLGTCRRCVDNFRLPPIIPVIGGNQQREPRETRVGAHFLKSDQAGLANLRRAQDIYYGMFVAQQ